MNSCIILNTQQLQHEEWFQTCARLWCYHRSSFAAYIFLTVPGNGTRNNSCEIHDPRNPKPKTKRLFREFLRFRKSWLWSCSAGTSLSDVAMRMAAIYAKRRPGYLMRHKTQNTKRGWFFQEWLWKWQLVITRHSLFTIAGKQTGNEGITWQLHCMNNHPIRFIIILYVRQLPQGC